MAEGKSYMGLAVGMSGGRFASMGNAVTTVPTTVLDKGDFFIHWNGTEPNLAVQFSSLAGGIKYIALHTKTLGYGTYP
jgi:hypothetical protein